MQRTMDEVRNELTKKVSYVATSEVSLHNSPDQVITAAILLLGDQLREINQRLSEIDNSIDNIAKVLRDHQ